MIVNKILFLHVPQNPQSVNSFIQVAPLGLVGLATYVRDYLNLDVVVMNAGSYMSNNFQEDFIDYVIKRDFDLVLLDLHWHQQLYDVLLTVNQLRMGCKYIAIGGMTASVFGRKLIEVNDNIDFLIRGEGEIPILELVKAINNGQAYDKVPNLIWRKGGTIIENPMGFTADSCFLDSINDWDLSIYDEKARYNGKIKKNQKAPNFFYVPIGRGCMEECSYCGGSKSSFEKCFNRRNIVFRSCDVVANTIINVHKNFDISYFYICYDIKEIPEEWWLKLFELIKKSEIKVSLFFEAYRIHSVKFFEAFYNTFNVDTSQIILSPGCFSDEARNIFTSVRYNLQQLKEFLEYVNNRVPIYIYFSLVPHSDEISPEKIIDNLIWCRTILNKFWNVYIYVSPIVIEPNSPWENYPDKYGLKKKLQNLNDFIENSNLHTKNNMVIGYQFDQYKLISSLYYGITNNISLTDQKCEETVFIHSVVELFQKRNEIKNNQLTLICDENIEQYVHLMLKNDFEVPTSECIVFRKINNLNDLFRSIKITLIDKYVFFVGSVSYMASLRNCLDFSAKVGEISTYRNLAQYNSLFDVLFYNLRKKTMDASDTIYIPNVSSVGRLMPICIEKSEDGTKKYYIASNSNCFLQEVTYTNFISLRETLENRKI